MGGTELGAHASPRLFCALEVRGECVTRVRDHLGVRGPSSPAGAGRARTKAQRLENWHVPRLQGLGVGGWVPTGGHMVPGAWAPSCGQREAFGATVGPLWQGGCGRPSAKRNTEAHRERTPREACPPHGRGASDSFLG